MNRRRLLLVAATATAALIAVAAVAVAVVQRDETARLADAAAARSVALEVGPLLDGDVTLARLLAAEAHALSPGRETAAALLDAVLADGRLVAQREVEALRPIVRVDEDAGQVVSTDGSEVLRWDLADGRPSAATPIPETATPVALSPDGSAVVVADRSDSAHPTLTVVGRDGTQLWSTAVAPGELPDGPHGAVHAEAPTTAETVALSIGGRHLVSYDPVASALWLRTSDTRSSVALPPEHVVGPIALSPDGRLVAVASEPMPSDPSVAGGEPPDEHEPEPHAQEPDAQEPASGPPPDTLVLSHAETGASATVTVIDSASGDVVVALRSSSPARSLGFSADGDRLAIGLAGTSGAVSAPEPADLPNSVDPVVVTVTTSGDLAPSVARPGELLGWAGDSVGILDGSWATMWSDDLTNAEGIPIRVAEISLQDEGSAPVAMGGTAADVAIVTRTAAGSSLTIWDRSADHGLLEGPIGPSALTDVEVIGDGRALTSGLVLDSTGAPIHVTSLIDLTDGRVVAEVEGVLEGTSTDGHALIDGRRRSSADLAPLDGELAGPWSDRRISPNGSTVAVTRGTYIGWVDVSTGRSLAPAVQVDHEPSGLTFSADGHRAAAVTYPAGVIVADVADGELLEHQLDELVGIQSAALSADGTWLAVGTASGRAWLSRLEDTAYGPPLALPSGSGPIASIRFIDGPDGDPSISITDEGASTTLVSVDSRRAIAGPIPLPVTGVSSSLGDGDRPRSLWMATPVGLMHMSLDDQVWSAVACASADRLLTADESARYFPERSLRNVCDG